MKLWTIIALLAGVCGARAQNVAAPVAPQTGEIALDGRVVAIDALTDCVTIAASGFENSVGNRQQFEREKPKILRLAPAAVLRDLRLNGAASLADLKVGDVVRAVGRNTDAALQTRALSWSSVEPPNPPDPDTPLALRVLMPPPEHFRGASVSWVEASFRSRREIYGNEDDSSVPILMLAARVNGAAALRLVELQTPNDSFVGAQGSPSWPLSDGTKAQTWVFESVDPRQQTVRARYEMWAPGAPAETGGEFFSELPVEIPIPEAPNGVLEPHTKYQTPRGATVELIRVEADDAKKHLKFSWKWTPPADAPDAQLTFNTSTLKSGGAPLYGSGSSTGGNDGNSGQVDEEIFVLPRGAPLTSELLLTEKAVSWRRTEFIHTFDVELPVAKIAAALPPPRVESDALLLQTSAENIAAALEISPIAGERISLWLKPANEAIETKAGLSQRVLLNQVNFNAPGQIESKEYFYGARGPLFWHADNAVASETETGWRVAPPPFAAQVTGAQMTVMAQLARVYENAHRFENIPLPRPGEIMELDDKWSDESVEVRKIGWVTPDTPDYEELKKYGGAHGRKRHVGHRLPTSARVDGRESRVEQRAFQCWRRAV